MQPPDHVVTKVGKYALYGMGFEAFESAIVVVGNTDERNDESDGECGIGNTASELYHIIPQCDTLFNVGYAQKQRTRGIAER